MAIGKDFFRLQCKKGKIPNQINTFINTYSKMVLIKKFIILFYLKAIKLNSGYITWKTSDSVFSMSLVVTLILFIYKIPY